MLNFIKLCVLVCLVSAPVMKVKYDSHLGPLEVGNALISLA